MFVIGIEIKLILESNKTLINFNLSVYSLEFSVYKILPIKTALFAYFSIHITLISFLYLTVPALSFFIEVIVGDLLIPRLKGKL
jgi:hypothetical protein